MTTNNEIIKKHSFNPMSATEQLNCSLDTLMNEARADTIKLIFDILNEIAEVEHGMDLESVLLKEPCRNIKSIKKYKDLINRVE